MFQARPFSSAFPPPVYPPVGDCFAFWDSSAPGLGLFCMVIALCRHQAGGHSCTLPHSRNMIEARPYAQDGLCCSVRHHFTGLHHSFSYCGLQVWLASRTGYDRHVWHASQSRHIVGASSAQPLATKRAPSLHTQKGNWYDELLSVH